LKKQSQFQNKQNGVKSVIVMDYGDLYGWGQQKNKANSKPIAGLWLEILNKRHRSQMTALKAQFTEPHLKKQSQSAQALMDVTSFMQGDYGKTPACGIEENKANSNPNKPNQSQILCRQPGSLFIMSGICKKGN